MKIHNRKAGFTLIEILVVIGIIAILAAIVIIAINPARQFAQARDTQRRNDATAILNGIGQCMADNGGLWNGTDTGCCEGAVDLPAVATAIGTGGVDVAGCVSAASDVFIPTYISTMPMDPSDGTAIDTGYTIFQDAATNRITIAAPGTEIAATPISVTR